MSPGDADAAGGAGGRGLALVLSAVAAGARRHAAPPVHDPRASPPARSTRSRRPGVVLTYATTGVFNFAHGGLGMISAFAYWQLNEEWDLPAPLAALLVLGVLGPVLGVVLERMFRGLRNADVGIGIVLTVAVTVLCIGIAQYAFETDTAHNLSSIISGTGARVRRHDHLGRRPEDRRRPSPSPSACGCCCSAPGRAPRCAPSSTTRRSPRSTARRRSRWPAGSWILGTELAMVAGILIGSGSEPRRDHPHLLRGERVRRRGVRASSAACR